MMRPRWHDAVIAVALVVLTAGGAAAIWGDVLVDLVRSEEPGGGDETPAPTVPEGKGPLL